MCSNRLARVVELAECGLLRVCFASDGGWRAGIADGQLSATSRHSRGPPATAAVDLSCEQAAAIIAHDRESHGRDLSLAIEGGDFPRWTLFIQMMTDAQAKAFRFNPF